MAWASRFWFWLRHDARHAGRTLLVNSPLMLLSLGLATVLWVYVTNAENPTVRRPFPELQLATDQGQIHNAPRGFIATSISPNTVSLTLIGANSDVQAVQTNNIDLFADMAGVSQPTRTDGTSETFLVPVHATVKKRGVRAEVNPQTVFITLQPETQQTVPIRINQVDSLPVGFELASPPTADPAQAQVVGLKQNVDAVDAVYADLHLTGLSVSTTVTVPLVARSSDGRTVSGPTVQPATAAIHVSIRRAVFSQAAYVGVQTHGKPAPGYQVVGVSSDPPSVTIQGTLDVLNSVTTIGTDPVEVEGATADVKRVVALRPPAGVTVVDATTVTATVSIAPTRGPGSVLVAPRFINAAPGLQVQTTNTSIVVSFTGPQPQILALKPGDITATVDLSGLSPGTYSIEPKVTLPAGLDRESVSPAKVEVTISGQSPPAPAATPAR